MFCPKCGAKTIEGADFCQKCGAKLVKDYEKVLSTTCSDPTASMANTRQQPNGPIQYVKLIITCVKVKGAFPGDTYPILVDEVQVGELTSKGTFTGTITPGVHRIKVGRISIGLNIPETETPITLNLQYGQNHTLELVCSQNDIVTKPSSIERATFQAMLKGLNAVSGMGLVLAALGVIGFIIGIMVPMGYSTIDYSLSIFISALLLIAAGAAFLILSPKTRKTKVKVVMLGLASVIAVGAVIVITNSTVSFVNWNKMVYVNAIKDTCPFDTAENRKYWGNISYAYSFTTPDYDEVFNYQIADLEWTTVNRDRGTVDVTGRLRETNEQITVHFTASSEIPYEIVFNGTSITDSEDISTFLYNMFDSFVNGEQFAPNTSEAIQTPVNTGSVNSMDEAQMLVEDWMDTHPMGVMAGVGTGAPANEVPSIGDEYYVLELWEAPREFCGMIYVRKSTGEMTFHDPISDEEISLDDWYEEWSSRNPIDPDEHTSFVAAGDTESWINLYRDGTFSMQVNLYVGYGTLSGAYEISDLGYKFHVEERSFSGYTGDNVEDFEMILRDDELEYQGEEIGTTASGTVYKLSLS